MAQCHDDFRDYFRTTTTVDGKEKAVCTICGRMIMKNAGCMRMHFTKVHEQRLLQQRQFLGDASDEANEDGSQCEDDGGGGEDSAMDAPPPAPMFTTNIEPYLERLRALKRDNVVKRTVKYLEVCPSSQLFGAVAHAAPDDVIAAICDAALNVQQGDIDLPDAHRRLFQAH